MSTILGSVYSEPGRHLERIFKILSDNEGVEWGYGFYLCFTRTTLAPMGENIRGGTKVESGKAFKTLLKSPHHFETEEKDLSFHSVCASSSFVISRSSG